MTMSLQNMACQSKVVPKSNNDFVMFNEGVYKATFILDANATPRTVEAANEFINYLEKMTGVKPQLLTSKPTVLPTNIVWIGNHPELKSIFPNINFELKQEEILIAANQNNLVIQGRDRFIEGFPKVYTKRDVYENHQEEYGTINAIYTFLQEYLEVRWFFPGELGEDVITKNKIAFKPFTYRYEPQIKARSGLFINSRLGRELNQDAVAWTKHNKTFYSSTFFNAGHPFVDWWGKYKDTNPKIFALTTKLERAPLRDPKYVKLCVSNTEIDSLWLKEVDKEIEQNPYTKIFSVNENDDYGSGFCVCENCKKLDHSSPLSDERNMSDRHLHFANRLAVALQKKYPTKDYKVLFMAYGLDRPLPLHEKPNTNVVVGSVANFHLRRKNNDFLKVDRVIEYDQWSKISKEQFWRPNLGNPVGLQWGMPDIAINQAFEDFSWVASKGCTGIFFDSILEHWSTQGLHYYVLTQLAWNPYCNKEIITNDYFDRMYNDGAKAMKKYWELIETTRQKHFDRYNSKHSRFFVHETYDDHFFQLAESYIKEAKLANDRNDNAKYNKRIEFTEEGLVFTKSIVKIRGLMSVLEKDVKNKEIELLIEKEWNEINTLKLKMNPLAINFNYVKYIKGHSERGSYDGRMTGLIPSKPITKKILKELARENKNLE